MRIVSVVGTRPQLIKAAALQPASGAPATTEILVDTGQHYDEAMAGAFFAELGLPRPDHSLGVGGGGARGADRRGCCRRSSRSLVTPSARTRSSSTATRTRPWPARSSAAKLGIPVAHVEAGLRCFDRRMPEEVNRVVADHLSTLAASPRRRPPSPTSPREGIVDGVPRSAT